jgi:hypothetical protein
MLDINDMSNLSLDELIPDDKFNENQLDLVLRALECKLLKIPERIKNANNDVDFSCGTNQSIIIDIDDMTTEMYELVMCIRECLPIKESK